MHLPNGINFSGYHSSSILCKLPRNGKDGWCKTCDSSNKNLRKFSFGSKGPWIQTHRKVKTAYSLFSSQPNGICLPQEIAGRDCSNRSKASPASGTILDLKLMTCTWICSVLLICQSLIFYCFLCSGADWWNLWTHNLCSSNSYELCFFARHVGEDFDSQWIFEGKSIPLNFYTDLCSLISYFIYSFSSIK